MLAQWTLDKDKQFIETAVDQIISTVATTDKNIFPRALTTTIVDYLEKPNIFGQSEWETFYGKVDPAPPLPSDFNAFWDNQCPIFSGKKVKETHMLFYIPDTINGKKLTLETFQEVTKQDFLTDFVGEKIQKSWVCMLLRDVPESIEKPYEIQCKIISQLAEKTLQHYEVPRVLVTTIGIITYHSNFKRRLFNPSAYTRCREKVGNNQMVVGRFDDKGLTIRDYDCDGYADFGVAPAMNLSQ